MVRLVVRKVVRNRSDWLELVRKARGNLTMYLTRNNALKTDI